MKLRHSAIFIILALFVTSQAIHKKAGLQHTVQTICTNRVGHKCAGQTLSKVTDIIEVAPFDIDDGVPVIETPVNDPHPNKRDTLSKLMAKKDQRQSKDGDITGYIFSQIWPASYCERYNCRRNDFEPNTWVIQGFLPKNVRELRNCKYPFDYDFAEVVASDEEIIKHWRSFFGSDENHLKKVWRERGSCSPLLPEDYFSFAAKTAESLDIYQVLADSDIIPGGSYQCGDIQRVLSDRFGVKNITVKAYEGKLIKVAFCFDKYMDLEECSESTVCEGRVEYPRS